MRILSAAFAVALTTLGPLGGGAAFAHGSTPSLDGGRSASHYSPPAASPSGERREMAQAQSKPKGSGSRGKIATGGG
jgi:hypothetical protein